MQIWTKQHEEYGQLSLTERVSKRSAAVGDLLRIGDLWNEQTKEAFSRLTRTKNKLSAHDHAAEKDRVDVCRCARRGSPV